MAQGRRIGKDRVAKALLASGGVITDAARALGCDRRTVARYIEQHEEVRAAYEDVNEVSLDDAEAGLYAFVSGRITETVEGEDGEEVKRTRTVDDRVRMDALKFYLRTKGRTRGYGDRLDLGFNPADLTDEQLAAIAAGKDPAKV